MTTTETRATDYSKLLETMTARAYAERYEAHLLNLLPDPDTAFREDTERAARVAAGYGLPPAVDGQWPLVIWDLARPAGTYAAP
jgi:CubicO group peptidase (beta-lactamase class C family)